MSRADACYVAGTRMKFALLSKFDFLIYSISVLVHIDFRKILMNNNILPFFCS